MSDSTDGKPDVLNQATAQPDAGETTETERRPGRNGNPDDVRVLRPGQRAREKFLLTGKGGAPFETVTHGGEVEATKPKDQPSPKEVEEFNHSEYQRFLKDGTLPAQKEPEKTSETKPGSEAIVPAPEAERYPVTAAEAEQALREWDTEWSTEEHNRAVATIPQRLEADARTLKDFETLHAAAAHIPLDSVAPGIGRFLHHALAEVRYPAQAFRVLALNPNVTWDMARDWKNSENDRTQRLIVGLAIRKAVKHFGSQAPGEAAPARQQVKEVTSAKKPPGEVGARGVPMSDEERENKACKDHDTGEYIRLANAREIASRRGETWGRRR